MRPPKANTDLHHGDIKCLLKFVALSLNQLLFFTYFTLILCFWFGNCRWQSFVPFF